MLGVFCVPTRPEHYRLKLRECGERAKLASDPETKRQYEDIARQCVDLAKWPELRRLVFENDFMLVGHLECLDAFIASIFVQG